MRGLHILAELNTCFHCTCGFWQAGGVQVLSQLLPRAAVTNQHGQELESDDEETNAGISEVQQMGLIALQVLHRVISSSLIGISYVIQVSCLSDQR